MGLMGRGMKTLCTLVITLLALALPAFAQNTSGSITGAVQDASGAVDASEVAAAGAGAG